jgi:PAS domain S-box-containing protein
MEHGLGVPFAAEFRSALTNQRRPEDIMSTSAQTERAIHSSSAIDRRVLQVASRVSAAIGDEFLRSVVEHLAEVLKADCVYIGEFVGGQVERVRTLAACLDRRSISFEYELAGSAVAQAVLGKPCICRAQAQKRFPTDPMFPQWNARAYVAIPLMNSSGRALGILMSVYRRAIPDADIPKAILEMFASRAAAELERKQQEERLRRCEERYRAFVALNANAMWRIEFEQPIPTALPEQEQMERIYRDGYIAECNDSLARQAGFERVEQVVGRKVHDLASLSNPIVRNAILHAIRTRYRFTTVEASPVGRDGKHRYMLRSQWGIVEDGVLRRIWVSSRDITDLKLSEMELDAAERRMSELLEDLQLLVVVLRPNGEIAFCNQHLYQLTGWQSSDVIGKDWVDLMIPASDRDKVRAATAAVNADNRIPVHFENPLLGPEGGRSWIAWDSISMRDSEGQSVATANVGSDITEFKKLEGQFQQAQKLESIGRLASGVANDLNNLLTVIMGYSGVMLDNSNPSDEAHTGLNEIRKAAEKGAELTQRLLAFSRRRVLRPEVLNLTSLIADDVYMIRHLIGGHIQLVTELDPSLGLVNADVGHLHQIMLNLVVNARDAMPHGGTLTISTSNLAVEKDALGLPAPVPGKFVQLTVTDTGSGMTEEVRSHMFEPFYTTKASGRGTGLGLSTVYGIVQESGGQIRVETEKGKGTSLRILLPAVEGEAAPAREPCRAGDMPRGTETILLVEDQAEVRMLAASILRDLGYRVLEAAAPAQALKFVAHQASGDGIDLLLTDGNMPGLRESEVADVIRTSRREMKILLMSGYTKPAGGQQGLSEHGLAWLEKPFTPCTLARAVREILEE